MIFMLVTVSSVGNLNVFPVVADTIILLKPETPDVPINSVIEKTVDSAVLRMTKNTSPKEQHVKQIVEQ
jgi:hypothetical protein